MSGKLDQSLDEIMKDRKPTAGARRGKGRLPARNGAVKGKPATAVAPTGGIQKNTKSAKTTKVRTTLSAATRTGDSKISVSNLPEDVTERLIKDYFGTQVAPVKHVILNYGPTGRSRGNATVIFDSPGAAAKAAKFDGIVVDNKPMRIEVLLGAKNVPEPPAPKSLSERMSKPKNAVQAKGKSTNAKPNTTKTAPAGTTKNGRNKKSGRAGRPKPKTAEELDLEMNDYWVAGESNGTAQPPAAAAAAAAATTNGGDTGMVDEVM